MKHWARLVGRPWTPEEKCWWLVRRVVAVRSGIDLPAITESNLLEILSVVQAAGWRRVEGAPKLEDLVFMRDPQGLRHAGLMIGSTKCLKFLHSEGKMTAKGPTGSCIAERLEEAIARGYREIELWRLEDKPHVRARRRSTFGNSI